MAKFLPLHRSLSLLLLLLLFAFTLASPAFARQGVLVDEIEPGGIEEDASFLSPKPGFPLPWQGSTSSAGGIVNTSTGNKLSAVPLVSWTARGGMPVDLTLYHNSQGTAASELGYYWTHSFDIYLVRDPDTNTATVQR